jgi:hypothetical protein
MNKCVLVIDGDLPAGLIANTAAVLSMSLGRRFPELIGPDVEDSQGRRHLGITTIVMPILRGSSERLQQIRSQAGEGPDSELTVIDVTDCAQQTKTCADYSRRLGEAPAERLRYLGLCLYGPEAQVRSLTGSLPLLK